MNIYYSNQTEKDKKEIQIYNIKGFQNIYFFYFLIFNILILIILYFINFYIINNNIKYRSFVFLKIDINQIIFIKFYKFINKYFIILFYINYETDKI